MYYESIPHKVVAVADAAEAATKIKTGKASSWEALCWKDANGTFYVVSDSHIDDSPFAETALLKEVNNIFFEIDSITAAWIQTKEELTRYFVNAEKFPPIERQTQLIVGEPTNQMAYFTCGCCGNRFHGNVKEQLAFDQDEGFGICTNCNSYF